MSFRLCPTQDALFLDIDGTLLDIAPTPAGVIVPQSLLNSLSRLYERLGGALALISGRGLNDIDALFSPLHLPASGVHGVEWRIDAQKVERRPLPEALRRNIHESFSHYPMILLEDKKYAMAVHYRRAPEMADTVESLLQKLVFRTGHHLSVMQGNMVFEVVYPGHHKGEAIERFMAHAPFAGRRPVFFGNDETDGFALNVCERLGGIGVQVGHNAFPSPRALREWINQQA